jgi:hypothetical protein
MKKILYLAILICVCTYAAAQCSGIKKYPIADSGCSAYFRTDPGQAEISQMEDGAMVYTMSCECDGITYGLVLVKFQAKISTDENTQIETAKSYCEVLKSMLNLTKCTGYGLGHKHPRTEDARGMIDYCGDDAENEAKIKAWVNTDVTALMYVYVPKGFEEKNNFNVQELFLNGFCFN